MARDVPPCIELTGLFLGAASRPVGWTRENVLSALAAICAAAPGATADWDEGAGEGWGRVIQGGAVVAYVCAWSPIVALKRDIAGALSEPRLEPATVLEVVDMSDDRYFIDRGTLERLYRWPISPVFNSERFSMDDLYCETV